MVEVSGTHLRLVGGGEHSHSRPQVLLRLRRVLEELAPCRGLHIIASECLLETLVRLIDRAEKGYQCGRPPPPAPRKRRRPANAAAPQTSHDV